MKVLIKILGWIFLISLAVIVQNSRLLDFWGINPNLILIFFFLPLILEKEFPKTLVFVFIILAFTVIFLPFWTKEILILGGLAIIGLFLRKFLTGREFWDFLILIFLGTLGFYLINNFSYFFQNPLILISELIYNMFLGSLLFFIFGYFYEKKETRIKS
jgi:hypothetical protein